MALRITVRKNECAAEITLEGRLAGPWVAELRRAWSELAPRLRKEKLGIDLRDVTYVDEEGMQVLREIVAKADAELHASTPLTQYFVQEISETETDRL